jgi:hypothetical protein
MLEIHFIRSEAVILQDSRGSGSDSRYDSFFRVFRNSEVYRKFV